VGTEVNQGEINILKELEPEMVEQQLAAQGPALHSLRGKPRRTLSDGGICDFYSESYKAYLQDVKSIQEILGQMQDSFVLAEF